MRAAIYTRVSTGVRPRKGSGSPSRNAGRGRTSNGRAGSSSAPMRKLGRQGRSRPPPLDRLLDDLRT